jgi:16S rRNA (uracil1498-N3)-methyltransferase
VERDRRTHVATFLVEDAITAGAAIELSDAAAHHAHVKRLAVHDHVRLTDGAGHIGSGTIASLERGSATIEIGDVASVPRPPVIHLRAPVADRDRMLWLAEKVAELGVASWQGVRFRRSASVSPRGEGPAFLAKVRSRMISALEQSGGAWMPALLSDTSPGGLTLENEETGILLDAAGAPLPSLVSLPSADIPVLLLGPEGGLEPSEVEELEAKGWRLGSLADTTLRFETAGVAAVAVCRALRR